MTMATAVRTPDAEMAEQDRERGQGSSQTMVPKLKYPALTGTLTRLGASPVHPIWTLQFVAVPPYST